MSIKDLSKIQSTPSSYEDVLPAPATDLVTATATTSIPYSAEAKSLRPERVVLLNQTISAEYIKKAEALGLDLDPTKPKDDLTREIEAACRSLRAFCLSLGIKISIPNLSLSDKDILDLRSLIPSKNGITFLELTSKQITYIPPEIGCLVSLKNIHLSDNQLQTLPKELGNLSSLQYLNLYDNRLQTLPGELGNLYSLRRLYLSRNRLQTLPIELGNLYSLEELSISENRLQTLPIELENLASLRELNLSHNQLQILPPELGNLSSLQKLNLSHNRLQTLPIELGNLSSLKDLNLSDNGLQTLPGELENLASLKEPNFSHNPLNRFPLQLLKKDSFLRFFWWSGYDITHHHQLAAQNLEPFVKRAEFFGIQLYTDQKPEDVAALLIAKEDSLDKEYSTYQNAPIDVPDLPEEKSRFQIEWILKTRADALELTFDPQKPLDEELKRIVDAEESLDRICERLNISTDTYSNSTEKSKRQRAWIFSLKEPVETASFSSEPAWKTDGLYWLDLSCLELTYLPPEIASLSWVGGLMLQFNKLTELLPKHISEMTNLRSIIATDNNFLELPEELWHLPNLTFF